MALTPHTTPRWSPTFQRGILAAVCSGDLDDQSGLLNDSSIFTADGLSAIAHVLIQHREEHGVWPERGLLPELCPGHPMVEEILNCPPDTVSFAAQHASRLLVGEALRAASYDLEEIAEDPTRWEEAVPIVEKALGTAQSRQETTSLLGGRMDRHLRSAVDRGLLVAPTGIPFLDRAMEGGLKGRQAGLILGATKGGKSHWCCWMGVQALKAGISVLHVTLELSADDTLARYERCATGMSSAQIMDDEELYLSRWNEVFQGEGQLWVQQYPKMGATPGEVKQLTRIKHREAQGKLLLIVDYPLLLRSRLRDRPDLEITDRYREVFACAQEFDIPVWTPQQTNREGFEMSMLGFSQAGGSIGPVQDADVILGFGKHREEAGAFVVALAGARSTAETKGKVYYDWAKTTIKEA